MPNKKTKKTKTQAIFRPKWRFIWIAVIFLMITVILSTNGSFLSSVSILTKPTPSAAPSPTLAIFFPPDQSRLPKEEYIKKAVNDLANKIKSTKSQIKVVKVEDREWSNTSLGCPKKDVMYAQVITPGFLIILSGDGKNYTYHAGLDKVVFCSADQILGNF